MSKIAGRLRPVLGAPWQEGMTKEFDDFIGAVPEYQMRRSQAEPGCQLCFQLEGAAVGIEIDLTQGLAHRIESEARGPQWILIGGELDDIMGGQTQFARHLFDRASRL